ncbi:MAG: transketolase [Thermaerobacter sp.]|nr:transketolase [Thermaerobacter sp.]
MTRQFSASPGSAFGALDLRAVNTIRALAIDEVEAAKSGHPGLPLGVAPMAYVLFSRHLRFAPEDPSWPDRDRFVLSAGHGSALLYALLHVFGYDLPLTELRRFRQWGSKTPGHPERGVTQGVEVTTGPLGQGIANAVGMALATQHLAARFNHAGAQVVTHRTFAICSDGDLMEGISHEAASFAGHLRLPGLVVLYDDNRISIEGSTDLAFTDDSTKRFSAYGWYTASVEDGNDLAAIDAAVQSALAQDRPAFIRVHTHIGFASPKQDTAAAHGSPLGAEGVRETKRALGVPEEPAFFVPEEVAALAPAHREAGKALVAAWQQELQELKRLDADLYRDFEDRRYGKTPEDLTQRISTFKPGEQIATRNASGAVLQELAQAVPALFGGSADLAPSNETNLKGLGSVAPGDYAGRNIHFGVREHAMAAAMNGMAAHGMVRPFGGTFLVFSDYMRPSVRLAALMGLPVTYVYTHDSIGLGEDGPTHQPIEHIAALELIPNLHLVRPADANETRLAWIYAAQATTHPTALVLSRQKLPVLAGVPEDALQRGIYALREPGRSPQVGILASGSEVSIALAAADLLAEEGIAARVLSAPCLRSFLARPDDERRATLPRELPHVVVLAGNASAFLPLLGARRAVVDLEHFGASAPAERLYQEFGITPQAVAAAAKTLL